MNLSSRTSIESPSCCVTHCPIHIWEKAVEYSDSYFKQFDFNETDLNVVTSNSIPNHTGTLKKVVFYPLQ